MATGLQASDADLFRWRQKELKTMEEMNPTQNEEHARRKYGKQAALKGKD